MKEYDGASVTFASYKSKYVDGVEDVSSRQYVDFSIGDYASWATVTKVPLLMRVNLNLHCHLILIIKVIDRHLLL